MINKNETKDTVKTNIINFMVSNVIFKKYEKGFINNIIKLVNKYNIINFFLFISNYYFLKCPSKAIHACWLSAPETENLTDTISPMPIFTPPLTDTLPVL